MHIAFTGHRNKTANKNDLLNILANHPNATLIHGGAVGFDSQVHQIGLALGFSIIQILPEYAKFGRGAPLVRNREIVRRCDMLVALFDGRKGGGTAYTIKEANKAGKPITLLDPA